MADPISIITLDAEADLVIELIAVAQPVVGLDAEATPVLDLTAVFQES